jgi:hypothetical protein
MTVPNKSAKIPMASRYCIRMNVLPRPRIRVQFSLRILSQEMDAEVWQRRVRHHD